MTDKHPCPLCGQLHDILNGHPRKMDETEDTQKAEKIMEHKEGHAP